MQYITAIRLSAQITHLKLKISKVTNSIINTYIIKLIEKIQMILSQLKIILGKVSIQG